jgi:plasmid maintenance system killer protein
MHVPLQQTLSRARAAALGADTFNEAAAKVPRKIVLAKATDHRVCFRWTAEGPTDVEIVDYH